LLQFCGLRFEGSSATTRLVYHKPRDRVNKFFYFFKRFFQRTFMRLLGGPFKGASPSRNRFFRGVRPGAPGPQEYLSILKKVLHQIFFFMFFPGLFARPSGAPPAGPRGAPARQPRVAPARGSFSDVKTVFSRPFSVSSAVLPRPARGGARIFYVLPRKFFPARRRSLPDPPKKNKARPKYRGRASLRPGLDKRRCRRFF